MHPSSATIKKSGTNDPANESLPCLPEDESRRAYSDSAAGGLAACLQDLLRFVIEVPIGAPASVYIEVYICNM